MNLHNHNPLPLPIEKLGLSVDVAGLRKKLEDHPEYFGGLKYRSTLGMDDMRDIWLRFNDITPFLAKGSIEGLVDEHDSIWYPIIDQLLEVKKIAFEIMAHVNGERLGGILISKLKPGVHIPSHRDWGWHANYYTKFFVPIKNAPGATFNFDAQADAPDFAPKGYPIGADVDFVSTIVKPKPGEVYEFNNQMTHGVTNNSLKDRIAMIICIKYEGQMNHV